jgi:hypothetical protein
VPAGGLSQLRSERPLQGPAPNQFWQTISPTSRSSAADGSSYRSSSMTSRASSSPGSCARSCGLTASPTKLQLALTTSGCDRIRVARKPRLLSDNGSSDVSGDLAKWLENAGVRHVHGAPCHPQTPGQDRALAPGGLTPANVHFGGGQTILLQAKGSNATSSTRDACDSSQKAAWSETATQPKPPITKTSNCRKHLTTDTPTAQLFFNIGRPPGGGYPASTRRPMIAVLARDGGLRLKVGRSSPASVHIMRLR